MEKMKLLERLALLSFLAGLGLGGAGVVLIMISVYGLSGVIPARRSSVETADDEPLLTRRSVKYTIEHQPRAVATPTLKKKQALAKPPVMADFSPLLVQEGQFSRSLTFKPLRQATDRLAQTPSWTANELPATTPMRVVSDTLSIPHDADRSLSASLEQPPAVATPTRNSPTVKAEEATVTPKPTPTPRPKPITGCPSTSKSHFDLIPVEGSAMRYPDFSHGDLNLGQRGYSPAAESPTLVDYNGGADADAPQLRSLFGGSHPPQMSAVYRINQWLWDAAQCGGQAHGCRGEAIADWPVTMIGLATTPGEAISIPERGSEIYGGGYKAMVLYAEEKRITLGYTRQDSIAIGYVIHLENVCVDVNLLALYHGQNNSSGWRVGGRLPALRNNQALGTAFSHEIQVAIRDSGGFLDPRSRKDWWQ